MPRGRRRGPRRSATLPAAATVVAPLAGDPNAARAPAPTAVARAAPPPSPRATPPAQADAAVAPEPGEQVWERTHLEQTMFALAREHADAAARCARSSPPNREGEQTHSLVSILMSFLALEAFINMVGGDRLGSRYRHYDRMPPESKWLEITRLVSKSGKTFDEDGPELRGLSTLRSWRNLLTHYKGEYEEVQQTRRGGETKVEALLSAENAARAVEIVRTLYQAFYARDRRSAPRQFIWLDDRPHRPGGREAARPAVAARVEPAPHTGRPPASGSGTSARAPRRRRRRR